MQSLRKEGNRRKLSQKEFPEPGRSAFVCDVSVGGDVKGTPWGDSSWENSCKCILSSFLAHRVCCALSATPALTPKPSNTAQQIPLQKARLWWCHSSAQNCARASLHGPKEMCAWNPAVRDRGLCLPLHSHQHRRSPSQSQAALLFTSLYFFRGQLFLLPWPRQGDYNVIVQGKGGAWFLLSFVWWGQVLLFYFKSSFLH